MSKLLRNAKRRAKGAKAVRFEFSLEVQTLKLGADVADPMQLQWTRGSKAAVTDFVEPVNSTINWNTRLDLVVTLFADKNIDDPETVKFASKNSKIAVVAKTIRGSKRVGRCQIDLSEYAALTHNTCRPAHILLEKCNKPCELSVVVHARPLDLDVDTEETPSVASDRSMSMMSMSTMAMSPAPSTSPAPSLHRRAPSARKNLFARTDSVDSKSHQLFATSENDTVSDKPAPASDTPKEAKTQNDKSSKPTHQRKAETPKRDTKTETQVEPSLSAQTQPIEPSTEDASKRASRSSFVSSRRTRSLKSVESQTRALSPVLPVSQETHVSHKPALETLQEIEKLRSQLRDAESKLEKEQIARRKLADTFDVTTRMLEQRIEQLQAKYNKSKEDVLDARSRYASLEVTLVRVKCQLVDAVDRVNVLELENGQMQDQLLRMAEGL